MKLVKLGVAAIAILTGISSSAFTAKAHKAFVGTYYWYSVVSGVTGNFKTAATLATEKSANSFTQVANPGHTVRFGFAQTITNHAGIQRTYTLYN